MVYNSSAKVYDFVSWTAGVSCRAKALRNEAWGVSPVHYTQRGEGALMVPLIVRKRIHGGLTLFPRLFMNRARKVTCRQ